MSLEYGNWAGRDSSDKKKSQTIYGVSFCGEFECFCWECGHDQDVIILKNSVVLLRQMLDQILRLAVKLVLVVPLHVLREYHDNFDRQGAVERSKVVCPRQGLLQWEVVCPLPVVTMPLKIHQQKLKINIYINDKRQTNRTMIFHEIQKYVPFPFTII